MPRPSKPLTDKTIRDAIAGRGARRFPLFDGRGLHLVERGGHHHWRLKYARPDGRENRLALGTYPDVSLAEARTLAEKAHASLRQVSIPHRNGRPPRPRQRPPRRTRSLRSQRAGSK